MGSPGEEGGEDSFAASGSFLNLRLGDNGNSALPPLAPNMHSLAGSVDVDNDTHSALQTGMSTASMYGGALDTVTKTSDSLGSKVSMWDLRCDILSLLEGAKGAPTAEVSIDVLERMRHVMRDHIRSRKVQRGLAQQAKAAHTRAEGLQRDNLSLKSQLNMLTEQLQASNGGTDNGSRTPEVTPGSVAGSSWCMSGSSGQSSGADPPSNFSSGAQAGAATEVTKMKALRSGESMDARSQKSDHLTGDEMDMLGAGASGLKGSSSPNLRDHSPIKPRNGADSAQRLNRALHALADERRKNQVLERKLEDLQLEAAALERRLETTRPSQSTSALASATAGAPDPNATPRRGWSILNMIREASAVGNSGALPANGETSPHGHNNNSSAELDDDDLSPHGDKDEVVLQLAQTKVSLAQVEGKLAEARRDLSRMRELNNALNTRIESLTEERDKSWEDVGNMMLEIRHLQAALENAAMDAEHSGTLRNVHSGPIISSNSFRTRNPTTAGPEYMNSDSFNNRTAVSNLI